MCGVTNRPSTNAPPSSATKSTMPSTESSGPGIVWSSTPGLGHEKPPPIMAAFCPPMATWVILTPGFAFSPTPVMDASSTL
jgi:hypothetical protein